MNCKTKTRARNIALDDITSKSQWDRTFYPKKNTLIQKAAGLEICSGAQVAVVVWAPTGEQFYYAEKRVEELLKKSNMLLKGAIKEKAINFDAAKIGSSGSFSFDFNSVEDGNKQKPSMSKKMTHVSFKKEVECCNSITKEKLKNMKKDAHKFYKQKMKQKEKRESIVLLSPANKKQRVVCDAVESSESSSEYESESSDEDLFDKKKKFFKISQSGEMSEQIDLSSNEDSLDESSSSEDDKRFLKRKKLKAQIKDFQRALEQLPSKVQPSNTPAVMKEEPDLVIKPEPTKHGYPEVRSSSRALKCVREELYKLDKNKS